MCPVDRRRYRDGDFNGQWTSQLAPSQCSGILFPPRCSFFTSLRFTFSLFLSFLSLSPALFILFLHISFFLCLPYLFSLFTVPWLKFFIPYLSPSFSLSSLSFCCQAKLPIYMRPGRLPDWSGILQAPLSPRTREHRKPGSYLIRGEVYSPVDSNWARNHRALLFSVRTLKKTLTNSRFLAYYCRTVPLPPSPPSLLSSFCQTSPSSSWFSANIILIGFNSLDKSALKLNSVSECLYIVCLCVFIFYKNWDIQQNKEFREKRNNVYIKYTIIAK